MSVMFQWFASGGESDPFIPILDRLVNQGFALPQLAYGFRKLTNTYTGDCCVVKRNDGQNLSIGWVPDPQGSGYEIVDLNAIAAWCGTGEGTIRILYNQGAAGGAWNLEGGGQPQSPRIYLNGPELEGTRLEMNFRLLQDRSIFVNAPTAFNVQEAMISSRFSTINADSNSRRFFALQNDTFTNGSIIGVARNTGSITFSQRYPEPQIATNLGGNSLAYHTYFGQKVTSGVLIGIDGSALTSTSGTTANFNAGRLRLGGAEGGASSGFEYNGRMQEWICWDTNQPTLRTELEADIAAFYV